MSLSKIEKQSFIFGRYDVVTPVMRFRFMPHISSKSGERIAMIAIAADHLPNCVAAGEKNCQGQRDSAPLIDMRKRSSRNRRPMGSLVCFNTCRRTAHRAVATKIACCDLRRQQQTERWHHRENSVDAL